MPTSRSQILRSIDIDGAVEIRATLHGNGPIDLTSPVDAVTRIDTAICQSLLRLGLYEEFDVASRSLKAAPAQPVRPLSALIYRIVGLTFLRAPRWPARYMKSTSSHSCQP